MRVYDAVLFDLFGTVALFDFSLLPAFEWDGKRSHSTMGRIRDTLEDAIPELPFERFHEALGRVSRETTEGRARDLREVASAHRFASALARAGMPESNELHVLADRLSHVHMELLAGAARIPIPHVEFLNRVRKRYRTAVVSNFDHAPTARRVLDRDHVTEHFEHIVISEEHGWRKPHPKIFSDALELLGVEPQAALFVGDTPLDDIVGARAAGMDVAWVNARGEALPSDIAPADYEVRAIPALVPILWPER